MSRFKLLPVFFEKYFLKVFSAIALLKEQPSAIITITVIGQIALEAMRAMR